MIGDTSSFTRLGFLSYIRPHLHHVQPVFEAVSVSVLNTCTFTVFSMWCECVKGHFLRSHLQKALPSKSLPILVCCMLHVICLRCLTFNFSFHYFDCILFNVNDNWWCQTTIFMHHTFGLACPWIICSLLLIFFLFVPMFVLILAAYS